MGRELLKNELDREVSNALYDCQWCNTCGGGYLEGCKKSKAVKVKYIVERVSEKYRRRGLDENVINEEIEKYKEMISC